MTQERIGGSPWVVCTRQPSPTRPQRPQFVILPHAGGGPAFYSKLIHRLKSELDCWVVHYPGRERRIADPLPSSLSELADTVAAEIKQGIEIPVTLFGHSMGAAIAHEVAMRIPEHIYGLILSGRGARTTVDPSRNIHLLSDDALIAEVCSLNATPDEVLSHPELRSMLLPAIRADYRIIETHTAQRTDVLRIPVVTYVGTDDPTTTPHDMDDWAERTTLPLRQREFPGDHFYFTHCLDTVADAIIQDVSTMVG